jgi:hypothetical protein
MVFSKETTTSWGIKLTSRHLSPPPKTDNILPFLIQVHIADVTHYVQAGSAIDSKPLTLDIDVSCQQTVDISVSFTS